MTAPRIYSVSAKAKAPILEFVLDSLRVCGCRIISCSPPDEAPFRIGFETAGGERLGIVAYAFFANSRPTRNRPEDEYRFQVKYSSRDGGYHEIWHDPYGIYTTLFFGVDLERGFVVGVDPVLHNPTRMFISVEFKQHHAAEILRKGWAFWEREKRSRGFDSPVETLVGATPERFLDFVRFEQAAFGLDQGHRYLVAETMGRVGGMGDANSEVTGSIARSLDDERACALAKEFDLSASEILGLIERAPRLKVAVRGWVAETHLATELGRIPEIVGFDQIEQDGQPDFAIDLADGRSYRIECKNVLRRRTADGTIRVDFQKTRASKSDPCSRYYRGSDFEILAACLHPATEMWEFRYLPTSKIAPHRKCPAHLDNRVSVGRGWSENLSQLFGEM